MKRFDTTRECLDLLEKNRFVSIVTSPHVKGRENVVLHEGDYQQYNKLAVWFGNAARGISDEAADAAAYCVGIPMFRMIESLNLGTSSAILRYEITKQRREYQSRYRSANRRGKRADPLPIPTHLHDEPSD